MAAGLIGRGTKFPPQFGHTLPNTVSAQVTQNVHSNVQITASVLSGGKSLSQHSQFGLSFIISLFPVRVGRAYAAARQRARQLSGTGIGSQNDADGARTTLDLKTAPPTILFNMEKPTICALNGVAAGYGMDTALGCDIRIMAESAKFAAAFVKRGIVPELGGTWFLPRMLGWAIAAEIIFTGRTLSAKESLEMGLTNHIVPDSELMPRARALAAEIAANAPLAVQSAKRTMRVGLSENFNDHVHHVFLQLLPLMRTQDFREGLASFLEKRPADFKGR
ncbi:MAG: enoyl-CoA hydratase/isomerase family protein [Afipia birgiae]|nr:enoyl-CoA hydratase/isomerase family protein [Afipia birgiae]